MIQIEVNYFSNLIAKESDPYIILSKIFQYLEGLFGWANFIDENYDKKLDFLLKSLDAPKLNFYPNHPKFKDKVCLAVPANFAGKRLGTLFLVAKDYNFTKQNLEEAQWVTIIIINQLTYIESQKIVNHKIAKNVISMLSYSELEASLYVFNNIKQTSTIILGKIADEYGFSRSVISNALKKIESSGAIETRSLGVKGTNIKIINEKLIEELNKIRL